MICIINLEQLKYDNKGQLYEDGYRIVYFYNNNYDIGEYCKTIEWFMIGLTDYDPIIDEDEIPPFISNKDLLNKCIKRVPKAIAVAIYKTNGELIDKIEKE